MGTLYLRGRFHAPVELMTNEDEQGIDDVLNLEQEVHVLRDAIQQLKEQERLVLSLYYYEELKLHEIASIMELTESRVSQIRSKAISKLRASMAPLREVTA
jgi:RNA polymerase sigma factor FliA